MQGAGNDFIVVDNRENLFSDETIVSLAPRLCDRRFGIGADGIMLLLQSDDPQIDYTMFYRNADGSDAGMCGNGARCLALFACNLGMGEHLVFNVHGKIYQAAVDPQKHKVTITFPMAVEVIEITIEGDDFLQVHAGTEHIVKQLSQNEMEDEDELVREGKRLRYHPKLDPPGTNVNFIHGTSDRKINLQTYERGVENLTLACGTGAIASALAWHHLQYHSTTQNHTDMVTKGGNLAVDFDFDEKQKTYHNIRLTGEAQFVFKGIYTV